MGAGPSPLPMTNTAIIAAVTWGLNMPFNYYSKQDIKGELLRVSSDDWIPPKDKPKKATKVKFCSDCGQKFGVNDKFCSSCGKAR